ncbi:MAG: hypothetical protein HYR97_01305 [Candidatus Melainabacteria bacterium]|nr:hypothetical protein [Candidatus Melainabacteria bacterium]
MDAEETLAGLHNNGNWDAVWYTEASPYLIRVVVYKKDDDGNPGIEVSLSKKKPGEGLQFTNFTRRELDLLSQYKIGVFDHNSQKASPLISLNRDAESPSFEIPLSTCNQELDHSITLPAHREPDRQITPYSFSIFVTKTGK